MQPSLSEIAIALGLTLVAGLATGLGGLITLFTRHDNTRVLAFAMGLSAGVMTYISFMELLPEAMANFGSGSRGEAFALLAFFAGIALIAIIDKLVPEDENPHEAHTLAELSKPGNHHLRRTGAMLALAIGIHNFPEGMATFVSVLDGGMELALPIVIAIAIHNIPEGIAVFVPIYQSTGDKRKAMRYTFVSGLSEPAGALAGALFLLPFWSPAVNAACLAAVAGIMVYISFDELLPGAERHGHHHHALAGVITGLALMAISLLVL